MSTDYVKRKDGERRFSSTEGCVDVAIQGLEYTN